MRKVIWCHKNTAFHQRHHRSGKKNSPWQALAPNGTQSLSLRDSEQARRLSRRKRLTPYGVKACPGLFSFPTNHCNQFSEEYSYPTHGKYRLCRNNNLASQQGLYLFSSKPWDCPVASLFCFIVFLADHSDLVDQLSVVECVETRRGQRRLLFAAERLHGVEMLKQEETGVGVGGIEA